MIPRAPLLLSPTSSSPCSTSASTLSHVSLFPQRRTARRQLRGSLAAAASFNRGRRIDDDDERRRASANPSSVSRDLPPAPVRSGSRELAGTFLSAAEVAALGAAVGAQAAPRAKAWLDATTSTSSTKSSSSTSSTSFRGVRPAAPAPPPSRYDAAGGGPLASVLALLTLAAVAGAAKRALFPPGKDGAPFSNPNPNPNSNATLPLARRVERLEHWSSSASASVEAASASASKARLRARLLSRDLAPALRAAQAEGAAARKSSDDATRAVANLSGEVSDTRRLLAALQVTLAKQFELLGKIVASRERRKTEVAVAAAVVEKKEKEEVKEKKEEKKEETMAAAKKTAKPSPSPPSSPSFPHDDERISPPRSKDDGSVLFRFR